MKLALTITYSSGEEVTVVAQPPEFARWEKETGKVITNWSKDGYVGMWDMLFLSHSVLTRTSAKPVRPFDAWINVVDSCKIAQVGDADPKVMQQEA